MVRVKGNSISKAPKATARSEGMENKIIKVLYSRREIETMKNPINEVHN